jgi:hypothetical protein
MNDDDLEACFQMFAMAGWIMNGDYHEDEIPHKAIRMAKAMMEARKPQEETGIAAIKPRTRRKV